MNKNSLQIRKKYFIFPSFQKALLWGNFFILLMVFIIIGVNIYYSFYNLEQMGIDEGFTRKHPYFSFIHMQSSMIFRNLIVGFLASGVITTLFSLVISHKLAGPLCRLSEYFSKIKESGKREELKFRDSDYLNELPSIINQALEKLDHKNDAA